MMPFIQNMNLRAFDLNLLAVFDAIYSEGNLTRAANKLAMSQPAMSNALARLRRATNDTLFTRTPRGMQPTMRARRMAEPVRQALDLIQNSLQESGEFDFQRSTRTFSIAVEDYGEAVITPRFMDWLTHVAPEVTTKIWPEHSRALRQQLSDGSVDLAVDYFRLKSVGFANSHLMTDELVSMVREDHPVINETLSLKQYTSLRHVVLAQKRPMVDRELERRGLTRNKALEVPHFISMPLIVKSTDFVCTLPRRMAMLYTEHFRVKVLETPIDFPKIPIYLVWHERIGSDPGHTWLRNSLRTFCSRL